jgi:hypothetical protein
MKFIKDQLTLISALIAGIFTVVIMSYNSYDARASKTEDEVSGIKQIVIRSDYNVQMIARKVGIQPLEPVK